MKEARIQLRLTPEEKKKFEKAEALLNFASLSDFLRQAAHLLAEKAFQEERRITLNNEERDRFLNALANPPLLCKRLKEAMRCYSGLSFK